MVPSKLTLQNRCAFKNCRNKKENRGKPTKTVSEKVRNRNEKDNTVEIRKEMKRSYLEMVQLVAVWIFGLRTIIVIGIVHFQVKVALRERNVRTSHSFKITDFLGTRY